MTLFYMKFERKKLLKYQKNYFIFKCRKYSINFFKHDIKINKNIKHLTYWTKLTKAQYVYVWWAPFAWWRRKITTIWQNLLIRIPSNECWMFIVKCFWDERSHTERYTQRCRETKRKRCHKQNHFNTLITVQCSALICFI